MKDLTPLHDNTEHATARGPDGVLVPGLPNLSLGSLALFTVLFAVFDNYSYVLPHPLPLLVAYAHALAIVLVVLVNIRVGLIFFLLSLIFSADIPRLREVDGYPPLSSLMTVSLFGVTIGNYVALATIGVAVLLAVGLFMRNPERFRLSKADVCVLVIPVVYGLATLHGIGSTFENPRGALRDLNLPLMVCGLYFATRVFLSEQDWLVRVWRLMMLAVAAKAVVWTMYFVLGVGRGLGKTVITSPESGRVLLVPLLLFGLVLQAKRVGLLKRHRVLPLILSIVAGLNIFVQATRMAWIETAYGCVVMIIIGRFGDKLRWVFFTAVGTLAVFVGVILVRPQALDTIKYFASTLNVFDSESVLSSNSTVVRVYQFKNMHAQMVYHDNLILGEGPGSTYSDRFHPFPFPLRPGTDYTWEEIWSRRLNRGHGLLHNLLFNTGYGGMAAYLTAMLGLYLLCFGAFRRLKDSPTLFPIAFTLIACFPAFVYESWSAKNNMTLGFVMGIIACLHSLSIRQANVDAGKGPEETAAE